MSKRFDNTVNFIHSAVNTGPHRAKKGVSPFSLPSRKISRNIGAGTVVEFHQNPNARGTHLIRSTRDKNLSEVEIKQQASKDTVRRALRELQFMERTIPTIIQTAKGMRTSQETKVTGQFTLPSNTKADFDLSNHDLTVKLPRCSYSQKLVWNIGDDPDSKTTLQQFLSRIYRLDVDKNYRHYINQLDGLVAGLVQRSKLAIAEADCQPLSTSITFPDRGEAKYTISGIGNLTKIEFEAGSSLTVRQDVKPGILRQQLDQMIFSITSTKSEIWQPEPRTETTWERVPRKTITKD
jgi:hypothetical protein